MKILGRNFSLGSVRGILLLSTDSIVLTSRLYDYDSSNCRVLQEIQEQINDPFYKCIGFHGVHVFTNLLSPYTVEIFFSLPLFFFYG